MATSKKNTTPVADAPTAAYEVVSPLEHDLVAYAIGDEIDLTQAQAAPLLGHTVKPKDAALLAG